MSSGPSSPLPSPPTHTESSDVMQQLSAFFCLGCFYLIFSETVIATNLARVQLRLAKTHVSVYVLLRVQRMGPDEFVCV